MGMVARRVIDGEEHLAVSVEHVFSREQTIKAVMAFKANLRPRAGRTVPPLRASEVRQALRSAARDDGVPRHPVLDDYALEPPGGQLHELAHWVGRELVRLGLFTAAGDGSDLPR